jgi:hypothetical protein
LKNCKKPLDIYGQQDYYSYCQQDNNENDRPQAGKENTMKEYVFRYALCKRNVRDLCIKNDWCTLCDDEQYSRILTMAEDGAPTETLASMIWICSEGADQADIKKQLDDLARWPVDVSFVISALANAGFGRTEIDIVAEALRTHQDEGTAYKAIG